MGFYDGMEFYVALGIGLIPAVIFGLLGRPLGIYGGLLSLLFIYLVFKETPDQIYFIMGYVIYSCILIKFYGTICKKSKKNSKVYYLVIVMALMPLVVTKIFHAVGDTSFGFLGISYITFRLLQMIIEIYDRVIKDVRIDVTLSFLLFFPSFSSGPIDRSRRFQGDYSLKRTAREYLDMLGTGLFKIFLGLVYKVVISVYFYTHLQTTFAKSNDIQHLIGYGYCYGFYLFFDFAGYSLMAVGTAYILGVKLPDNFKMPFISKDIADFWNRWHISLSHWFRDFFFSRLMMKAIKGKWFVSKVNGACVCLVINMTTMGIWHGLSPSYIAYGFYHGLLLAGNEVWQKRLPFHKKYKKKKWYLTISWFVTLNLVMFGFFIFSGKLSSVVKLMLGWQ